MKKAMLLSILFCVGLSSLSQTTLPQYEIAKWFDDKKAAVSVNFDDNLPGQFSTALPILNAKGIKATFFVITGNAGLQWALLQSAVDVGHEVGSHSASHPNDLNFPALLQPQKEVEIEKELKNSYDAIMANLTGQTSLSVSWPFGKGGGGNDSIVRRVAKKYYFAARNTTAGTVNGDAYTHFQNSWYNAPGRDYYLQSGGVLMTSSTTKANIGNCISEIIKLNGWFSPYYHAVNQTGGYNNVTTEVFQQHMDTIASQSTDLWITTFGNASKYHRERNEGGATLTVVAEDASTWTLNLTDNLDNNIYNQPLTVLLKEPPFGVQSIRQNSKDIAFEKNGGILKFSVVPDGGSIVLKKLNPTYMSENMYSGAMCLSSIQKGYKLSVSDNNPISEIALYNNSGVLIELIYKGKPLKHKQFFDLPMNKYPKGVYFLKLTGKSNRTYKLIN